MNNGEKIYSVSNISSRFSWCSSNSLNFNPRYFYSANTLDPSSRLLVSLSTPSNDDYFTLSFLLCSPLHRLSCLFFWRAICIFIISLSLSSSSSLFIAYHPLSLSIFTLSILSWLNNFTSRPFPSLELLSVVTCDHRTYHTKLRIQSVQAVHESGSLFTSRSRIVTSITSWHDCQPFQSAWLWTENLSNRNKIQHEAECITSIAVTLFLSIIMKHDDADLTWGTLFHTWVWNTAGRRRQDYVVKQRSNNFHPKWWRSISRCILFAVTRGSLHVTSSDGERLDWVEAEWVKKGKGKEFCLHGLNYHRQATK